jgi:energy-coupling factor transport system ATP-binding protein
MAPPVVELGRVAGWDTVPLSVRDARRLAPDLRTRLDALVPPAGGDIAGGSDETVVARFDDLHASYGPVVALRGVSGNVHAGAVVALMGRNGAGKSTLLRHLVGLRAPTRGRVDIVGTEPHKLDARAGIRQVGLVPQDATLLLYHDRVDEECAAADRDAALAPGTTRAMLDRIVVDVADDIHPRDLSEGQRLGLVLAIVLAPGPRVVLLDEPTRGLDYAAKQRLVEVLASLAADGHAIVLATHDVEVVAQVADRVIVLAEGEVVADGPAREVVCHSPVFAPQVAKVLAPQPWLTVHEVEAALAIGERR